MIARLQHCSGALQAVSSVADNNRSRSKIGRLSVTRDGYSLVCLFAECIDNRAQPGPIPWFMSTPPFKNLNLIGSVCWNWRGKCQPNCKSLGHRDQNAIVLDWVIHDDLSKRFNKEMLLRRGVGRKKKCGQRRGGNAQSRRLQTTQRIQLRIGSRFAWHFVQWLRLKRTTAWSRRCNDLSSNGRHCKPKSESNVHWSSWTQQLKNGFQLLCKLLFSQCQSLIYVLLKL